MHDMCMATATLLMGARRMREGWRPEIRATALAAARPARSASFARRRASSGLPLTCRT